MKTGQSVFFSFWYCILQLYLIFVSLLHLWQFCVKIWLPLQMYFPLAVSGKIFLYSILFLGTFWSVVPTKWHAVVRYRKRLNPWLINQQWTRWWGLGGTKRQAGELLSGHGRNAKVKLMSYNRTQSRAVIGLLNGHNTLRRHLHRLGLTDSALCRKCGVEEETLGNKICKCEALASFGHVHLVWRIFRV